MLGLTLPVHRCIMWHMVVFVVFGWHGPWKLKEW